jgi:DNA-binding CsgD family transcriptional regulator
MTAKLTEPSLRHRQIADLLVRGMTNKAIAAALGVTGGTIDNHLARMRKMRGGLMTNAQLLQVLREERIVGQVYNINERIGDAPPAWRPVPARGCGSLEVFDVVRRSA